MKKFKTLELAVQFYRECEKLKMRYFLKDQLLRSSSSVALNLSEGNSKVSPRERKKYFEISYASLQESRMALLLAGIQSVELLDLCDHLGACLYKLSR